MTPHHAPKRHLPSAEVDLVLHALRFSLGKLWMHRLRRCCVATVSDIHGSIELVKNCLKIFGHAKLLTYGTLTILRKSSQSWILPKNKNKTNSSGLPNSFHHASLQHTRCTASFSLRYGLTGCPQRLSNMHQCRQLLVASACLRVICWCLLVELSRYIQESCWHPRVPWCRLDWRSACFNSWLHGSKLMFPLNVHFWPWDGFGFVWNLDSKFDRKMWSKTDEDTKRP